ncbi:MAG: ABC transporter ATP-binding protein [Chloroflexi bacterium]|nr:ABC transporter ATP-binding protein [Chloroflexota bacterium]
MTPVIEVNHLVHNFGDTPALRGIDFSVQKGEIFALLGPNGAGKTTTIRLLNGLFTPTGGQIRLLGLDPTTQGDQVRQQTGVLTETPALYERLTAWQNIEFFGTLAGMPTPAWRKRGQELLVFFELEKRANERVAAYSKGMKQRLALARALLHDPPVLFLDEPTSGLDPEAAGQVHDLIESIRTEQGRTVVLCTHNLVEAQRLCDRVAILQRGLVLASGSIGDLRKGFDSGQWVMVKLLGTSSAGLRDQIMALPGVKQAKVETRPEGVISCKIQVQSNEDTADLADYLVRNGYRLVALQPQDISLEDIYFKLQDQAKGEQNEVA